MSCSGSTENSPFGNSMQVLLRPGKDIPGRIANGENAAATDVPRFATILQLLAKNCTPVKKGTPLTQGSLLAIVDQN